MTDPERLSRLLDGDLPPDEVREMRERMAREPALAASFERMQRLATDLDALGDVPVPARIQDAALTRLSPPARGGRWTLWVAAAMVAASLGLWLTRPVPDRAGGIVLIEGTHRLDGHQHVLAGVVPVEVDGVAVITVEPQDGSVRARAREDHMDKTAIAAALAGAALTVAVYEGRAALTRADGTQLVVEAGQTASLEGSDLRPRRRVAVTDQDDRPPIPKAPSDDLQALRAENAALRERLEEAEFSGAITRGQLASHQGEPVPWPEDAPSWSRPASFEAGLQAVLADFPDARLAALDCDEFPCIAVLTGPNAPDDAEKRLAAIPRALVDHLGPEEPISLAISAAREDDPEVPMALGFVLAPAAGEGSDPDVATRAEYRARQLLEGVGPARP